MVDTNYTISSSNVTTLMIKNAQNIIDELVKLNPTLNKTDPGILDTLNKTLLNLFKILPRKMNKVQNYLVPLNTIGNETTAAVNKIIMREQDILDSLSSMVALNSTDSSTNQKIDILEQMGISMSIKDSKLEDKVNKLLGSLSDKYINSWYVKNIKTQTAYDAHLTSVDDKQEKLFWHGSRNENWINIVQKGLMIRPSGVVITGAMFGNGIYFADRALKSYGYTSGKGSRWASGNSDVAFMALYRVHVGKQLDVYEHTSECYKFDEKYLKRKGGYDSVYAHKGKSLMNNEFMVYNTNQATIYALVELRG
jgi:poly [ADP-ribose] polymerase